MMLVHGESTIIGHLGSGDRRQHSSLMLALDGSIRSMVDQKYFRMPQTAMDSNVTTNNVLGSYVTSLAAAHMLLCTQQQRTRPLNNNNGSDNTSSDNIGKHREG